ncbi:MAG: transposase [Acidobacteriota bacterium]|nr:transposase [Acidobacteriota bacterium]
MTPILVDGRCEVADCQQLIEPGRIARAASLRLRLAARRHAQDHRRVKQRYYPMLGFKSFSNESGDTLAGFGLAQKIKKGQFDTSSISQVGALVPQVWEAVLAA